MRAIALLLALLGWSGPVLGHEVKMRVVDENGTAVAGAEAVISFVGFLQEQSDTYRGYTDAAGMFSASGQSPIEVYLEARKSGHYLARVNGLSPKRDLDEIVVFPRILDPVPLYAWGAVPGTSTPAPRFPVQNEWLGFDFQAADWVAPHGAGKVADIRFRFRNEFKGWIHDEEAMDRIRRVNAEAQDEEIPQFYGKWDAELEISFLSEKEGIYEEPRFWPYNRMKMPHKAPEEGYVPTWSYTAKSYEPRTAREDVGFFLRTRVKLDEAGNIVSANYTKVVGDFYLVPQGSVKFKYYFNPVPNDRNLEFNPERNLFPPGFPGARVNDP